MDRIERPQLVLTIVLLSLSMGAVADLLHVRFQGTVTQFHRLDVDTYVEMPELIGNHLRGTVTFDLDYLPSGTLSVSDVVWSHDTSSTSEVFAFVDDIQVTVDGFGPIPFRLLRCEPGCGALNPYATIALLQRPPEQGTTANYGLSYAAQNAGNASSFGLNDHAGYRFSLLPSLDVPVLIDSEFTTNSSGYNGASHLDAGNHIISHSGDYGVGPNYLFLVGFDLNYLKS